MKLVYYHPIAIKNQHPFQKVVNPLISLMDRNNNIWPNYDYINLFPMPKNIKKRYDFIKICEERIKELTNNSFHISILWSGGIDSTFIICLMIKLGILEKLYKENRLTIGLNSDSIKENPNFYSKFILLNYSKSIVQSDYVLKNLVDNGIIITGEMADNLFGSLTMKSCVDYYNNFNIIHEKWHKSVEFLSKNLNDNEKKSLYEFIEDSVYRSPVEIYSNHDLLWYLNFNFKWQSVNFRIVSHCENQNIGNKLIKNLAHFFNTEDFQKWSLQEGHYFEGNDWSEYKIILKKLIFEITKDRNYFIYKTKYPSLPGLLRYKDTFDFIYYDTIEQCYTFSKKEI